MRLLIYGLQSSGASSFTFFLGQRENAIAIPDIWSVSNSNVPRPLQYTPVTPLVPDTHDSVVKCEVTTKVPFKEHRNHYRPDKSILFLRDPQQNYASLRKKGYRNDGGSIDEKFRLLDSYFVNSDIFDLTVFYEDFVLCHKQTLRKLHSIGWPAPEGFYSFPRSLEDIVAFNCRNSHWCRKNYGPPMPAQWGTGNIKQKSISRNFLRSSIEPSVEAVVRKMSPNLP